ncbi:hypothetical protein GCM10017668_01360 [Streptomyces tuirus]|uniref:Uncharacterized protein n=1 Tax=Streptomyces tuirus TaxID=68278 RepID=A0A7G1N5H0_9ACTN|nr:hypothetical protein GCM10017668_01360 [Streptomyces tuirus]
MRLKPVVDVPSGWEVVGGGLGSSSSAPPCASSPPWKPYDSDTPHRYLDPLVPRLAARDTGSPTHLLARATDSAGRTQPDLAVPNTQGYLFDAVVRHPVSVV